MRQKVVNRQVRIVTDQNTQKKMATQMNVKVQNSDCEKTAAMPCAYRECVRARRRLSTDRGEPKGCRDSVELGDFAERLTRRCT